MTKESFVTVDSDIYKIYNFMDIYIVKTIFVHLYVNVTSVSPRAGTTRLE